MAPLTATRVASFAADEDWVPLHVAPAHNFAVLAAGDSAGLLRVTDLAGAVLGEAALAGAASASRVSPDSSRLLTIVDVGDGPVRRRAVVHSFGPDMSLIPAGTSFGLPGVVADAAWLDDRSIIAVTVQDGRLRAMRCAEGGSLQPVTDWGADDFDIRAAACGSRGFAAMGKRNHYYSYLATWQFLFPREQPEQPELNKLDDVFFDPSVLEVDEARRCLIYSRNGISQLIGLGWDSQKMRQVSFSSVPAFGGDCLAFFDKRASTASAFLLTRSNPEPWGNPWDCGPGTRLRVDRGDGQTFVTVSGGGAVSVFLLTDYDVLETYAYEADRRLAAARRLGRPGRREAVSHLARLLGAHEEAEREAAVTALGEVGTDEAVDALLPAAGRTGDAADRARQVLRLAPPGQLSGAVQRAVSGQRRGAIRGSAVILGERTDVPATPELCVMAGDSDPRVRSAAATALVARADPVSLPTLLTSLADPDEATAQAAWRGAARIAGIGPDGGEPEGTEPASLAATGPFIGAVLRSGRLDKAREEHPDGARVLGLVASALAGRHQPRDGVLNALQGLGRSERHRAAALVTALLVADHLAASGVADDGTAGVAFLLQAADAAAVAEAPEVEWRTRARLGDLSASAGRWRAADSHYAAAEQVIDRLWARLLGDLDDRFFFSDKAALYESAMMCRLRLGHAASALETLEKAKTRFLGDLIARRNAAPRAGLEAVGEVFWRAAGQRRPTAAVAGGTPAGGGDQEIIGVSLGEEATEGDSFPAALSALLQPGGAADPYAMVTIVRDMWAVAAGLAAGAYTGLDEELARDAVTELDDALGEIRAAQHDPALAEEAIGRYLTAGATLSQLGLHRERRYGWGVSEFGDRYVRPYAAGDQVYEPFIDALSEAASFVTGRAPVMAAFGAGEAAVTAWQGDGAYPVPGFAAALPAARATSGADPAARSATTALTAVAGRHWEYIARVARGETSGLREAVGLVRPEQGTALVEFAVTKTGTITYAVTASDDLGAYPLPAFAPGWAQPAVFAAPGVTAAELTSRLTGPGGWKEAYERRGYDSGAAWRATLDSALSWLHAELFQPLEPLLRTRGVRRLLVVPHRGLHLLPITAWWCQRSGRRRYVLDDYEICFAPSLTLLQICAERHGQPGDLSSPLALLDPTGNLPLTRFDALALGPALSPGRAFAGPAATLAQWRAAGANASPAHYAGHAKYNWGEPLDSNILLHDGALTLGEMFDEAMPLAPAAEIGLLGCETSMTDPRDLADEYLGLASGFLFAGASSVLSTLWAVQEAPAMLLTARYHTERQRGAHPSAALRAAQQWLRDAGPADVRRMLKRASDLERMGLLNDDLRDALPRIGQQVRPWKRRPFAHPMVWSAYTATGH